MTTFGWIFMTVSLTCVWGGAFLCFKKVLETPEEEKVPVGFGP
jgi:hypothetical protein